jgi:AdoMet-dependent rRNA methyltransferase SPB1
MSTIPEDDDDEEESESSMDDLDRAKALTMGKSLLRRKTRQDLLDDAYNRYAHNDRDAAPEWFVADERRHSQPVMPISRAVADELKEMQKTIDARPIKKIAEAKARKKMKSAKQMEKIKKSAGDITKNPEMSEAEKSRAIQKLYKKLGKKKKVAPTLVVTRKSGGAGNIKRTKAQMGGRIKLVDARQKSRLYCCCCVSVLSSLSSEDKRGAQRAEKRKGGRGGRR